MRNNFSKNKRTFLVCNKSFIVDKDEDIKEVSKEAALFYVEMKKRGYFKGFVYLKTRIQGIDIKIDLLKPFLCSTYGKKLIAEFK